LARLMLNASFRRRRGPSRHFLHAAQPLHAAAALSHRWQGGRTTAAGKKRHRSPVRPHGE